VREQLLLQDRPSRQRGEKRRSSFLLAPVQLLVEQPMAR